MKRIVIIAVVMVFIAGLFASCNSYVCPAYASDDVEQTDNTENS